MKQEYAEKIANVINEESGHDGAAKVQVYSGRGMGRETFGVVCHGLGALLAGVAAISVDIDNVDRFISEMGDVKQDNMGLSTIYY